MPTEHPSTIARNAVKRVLKEVQLTMPAQAHRGEIEGLMKMAALTALLDMTKQECELSRKRLDLLQNSSRTT